jgi:transmembrane sensor
MKDNEEKVSAAIAEQAGERFVLNDEGPLGARDAAALTSWLKASPVHVEEFLGVSIIARELRELRGDPAYSLDAVLEAAHVEDDTTVQPFQPRAIAPVRGNPWRRWQIAAVTIAALGVLCVGMFSLWSLRPIAPVSAPTGTAALHIETRHGEQLTRRLADNSVLHLNTDSAVTIRYGQTDRLITLTSGQADFEVAHERDRAFRVVAGAAEVVDLGTKFDVRLEHHATVVTVVEGRVAVGPSLMSEKRGTNSGENRLQRFVELGADQQLRLVAGEWPPTLLAVDSQAETAWLRQQIAFDHEPLERVAAEFNRYAPKPIEIVTPSLRNLQISGVFATDDTEAFIAFLRRLKGVRVEVTATQIRVSGDSTDAGRH